MKYKTLLFIAPLLSVLISCSEKPEVFSVNFKGEHSGENWSLAELNPELPSDWSSYGYLSFEMYSTTTQRFDLNVYDREGLRSIKVHPFQGVWVGASIPLSRFMKMNTEGFTMSLTY